MRPRLKISRAGIELIESFEGLRRRAARLPDGRWTIGYGHTLSAREGAEVTPEDAEALLLFDLLPVVEAVNGLVFVELTQNQFDALSAFAFNVGVEAFRGSDVLKRVNEGRLTEAACAFDLWRKADIAGEEMVLDALIRRRAAEKALFLVPPEGFVPTPTPLVRPAEDPVLAAALPQRRPAYIETPLEGEEAIVRRVGPVDEPEPVAETPAELELAAEEQAEPGAEALEVEPAAEAAVEPETTPEPVAETPSEQELAAVELAEPGVEAVEPTLEPEAAPAPPAAEPADAAAALWSAFEAQVASTSAAEPGAEVLTGEMIEAAIEVEAEPAPEAVIEAAPLAEPEPQTEVEPEPQPEPVTAAAAGAGPVAEPANEPEPTPAPAPAPAPAAAPTVAAAAAMSARLFSPYGGGISFGALPPRATLTEVAPAPVEAVAPVVVPIVEPAVVEAPAVESPALAPVQTAFEPVAQPLPQVEAPSAPTPVYAEAAPSKFEPPVRPEPAVAFETGLAESQPFTLTPPPEREPAFMPQAASVVWSQPAAAEADDETPLFEETWQEVRPAPRIIRHEPVQTEPTEEETGPTGPFILLGFIGLAAFGGAVAAFLKSKQVAAPEPAILAWALALLAVGCVSISVYFLLKRLGGVQD